MIVICLEGCHGAGKTAVAKKFRDCGYTTIDESFLDQGECSMHAQSLTMESKWVTKWFDNILAINADTQMTDAIYIADRSPYSAMFYAEGGEVLKPLIDSIKKELQEKKDITIFTIHLAVERELLWDRITDRLKREPNRKEWNEDSRDWMENVQDRYNSYEDWDFTVKNNRGTMEEIVSQLNKICENI